MSEMVHIHRFECHGRNKEFVPLDEYRTLRDERDRLRQFIESVRGKFFRYEQIVMCEQERAGLCPDHLTGAAIAFTWIEEQYEEQFKPKQAALTPAGGGRNGG